MRYFLIFIAAALMSCAPSRGVEQKVESSKLLNVPNLSTEQLYIETQCWMVTTFSNAPKVIHFSDKEYGVIMGRYIDTFYDGWDNVDFQSTLRIDINNQGVALKFSQPLLISNKESITSKRFSNLRNKSQVELVKKEWNVLTENYKEHLMNVEIR